MNHRLRVGVDLDGVLYPFVAVVRAWLVERGYSGADGGEAHQWAFYRDWGLTDAEWDHEFVEGIHAGAIFGPADCEPDGLRALKVLAEGGHEVHLITSRNVPGAAARARQLTFEWVAELGFPFHSVTVSADKGVVETDVFLEDSPATCRVLEAEADTVPFLLAQPYNVGDAEGLRVVDGFGEFVAAVDGLLHELGPEGGGFGCERCGDWWSAELVDLGLLGTCSSDPLGDGAELGEDWPEEGDDLAPSE